MAVTPVRLIDSTKGAEEKLVGKNSPTLPDVLNRPLQDVLSGSGYKTDGTDFAGMAKTAHTHLTADVTDFLSTGSPTATDANASATDYVFTSLGGVLRRLGLSSLAKWLNARKGIYSVIDYGAKGDGVTDDTTAIQLCLDTAGQNSRIIFPPGKYLHTGLTFQSGQTLEGIAAGPQLNSGQSTLTFTGASGSALAPKNAATTNTVNVGVVGLTIDAGSGGDTALDLTRVSYGDIRRVYALGGKASAVGIRLDAKVSGQCYFNVLSGCKADMTNGVDVAFDNGANANVVVGGKYGNAQTGMRFTASTTGNVVLGADFETNAVQHISIDSTSSRNALYGLHMEAAPIGIKNDAVYTVVHGLSLASSVTTPIQDSTGRMITQYTDTSDAGYLGLGYLQISQTNFSSASHLFIDPKTVSATANSIVHWFRNVSTTGSRQIQLHQGDGSGTVTITLDAGAGIITTLGSRISGNAGTSRSLNLQTAGSDRWTIQVTSDAESGGNAGSNFNLLSRKDDGSPLNTIVHVDRAAGLIQVCQDVGTHVQVGPNGLRLANMAAGSFTCAALATTTVADASVTAGSFIFLSPGNAAAATLQGSTKCLYISARTAGASFAVTTAAGTAAAGTETFFYWIVN